MKGSHVLLTAYVVPYLIAADPEDPDGRAQIDMLIEMVREWTGSPKPKLAKRAVRLLAKLEAVRVVAY